VALWEGFQCGTCGSTWEREAFSQDEPSFLPAFIRHDIPASAVRKNAPGQDIRLKTEVTTTGKRSTLHFGAVTKDRSRCDVLQHINRRLHSMKRTILVTLMILAIAGFAAAQIGSPSSDVLGAHLNYGRGCAACHAPHSGAYGNGAAKTNDPTAGNVALWGQDVASLYGKTLQTGGGSYTESLPTSLSGTAPDVLGLITCLSCHDGNYAQGAMMKNAVYETLPGTYGKYNTVPTLLGNDGSTTGNYLNDHPVGLNATVSCGGAWNWDCTETNGVIQMVGPNSSQFVKNY
jgi:hypothetical protein